jgi:membrane-associated protein
VQADLALLGPIAPANLIDTLGVLGVLLILFAETGLLVGFFLPGDSLLFVAGYATSAGGPATLGLDHPLPLGWVIVAAGAGALIGAQVGYYIGLRGGAALFRRPDARLFKHEYVERTEVALQRFGPARAVVVARFVPILRTFMNPMAGAVRMPVRQFTLWQVVGGVFWTVGLVVLGHYIGHVGPIRKHIELFVLVLVVISVLPLFVHLGRERRRARSDQAAS